MRPWIFGSSGLEAVGSTVGDGITGRITDPSTGAGLFNPNTDPAVVGIDPLTGSLALVGTDIGLGAAFRREVQTGFTNGAFGVLPPGGVGSVIVSDPADAGYNPLPGWYWVPAADGSQVAAIVSGYSTATGNLLQVTSTVGATGGGYLYGLSKNPESYGQQFRGMFSLFVNDRSTNDTVGYTWLDKDLGEIYSEATTPLVAGETKVDCGLVPINAAYLRVRYYPDTLAASHRIAEIRVAYVPAEVQVNLFQLTSATALGSSEAQIAGITIPHATFTKGATYRICLYGTVTNTSGSNKALTISCRIGSTSLSGTVVATNGPNVATGNTDTGFIWEARATIRSTGSGGTVFAVSEIRGDSGGPFPSANSVSDTTATSSVNTTLVRLLEVTASIAAGASGSIHLLSIVCENS